MSTAEPRYCYRHPDRETGLSCSDCGRPICADCATFAPVGIRCPDHAGAQGGKKPLQIKPPTVRRAQGLALATGTAPITKALIAVNVAVYLVTAVQGAGLNNPGGRLAASGAGRSIGPPSLAERSPGTGSSRRCSSTAILSTSAFNMYILWGVGTPVEQYLGCGPLHRALLRLRARGRRRALLSGAVRRRSSAHPGRSSAILGAMLILEWQATGRLTAARR